MLDQCRRSSNQRCNATLCQCLSRPGMPLGRMVVTSLNCRMAPLSYTTLQCKTKRQYLLTCKVRRYLLYGFAGQNSQPNPPYRLLCGWWIHQKYIRGSSKVQCHRRWASIQPASGESRGTKPILVYCWPTVYDVGPTVNQHWLDASCLPGYCFTEFFFEAAIVNIIGLTHVTFRSIQDVHRSVTHCSSKPLTTARMAPIQTVVIIVIMNQQTFDSNKDSSDIYIHNGKNWILVYVIIT